MAITKSAKKRIRSSLKKKAFNLRRSKTMKLEIKDFLKLIVAKKVSESEKKIPSLYKAIDKAVKKGVIKKNNASRKKSRLTKKISNLKSKKQKK